MTTPIGPYMNEDGDWWVPVDAASFRVARDTVVGCLQYSIPEDGRLAYAGREWTWLDPDHEAGCSHEGPDACRSMFYVEAWHFEERLSWWSA